jgi:hypothetical protein
LDDGASSLLEVVAKIYKYSLITKEWYLLEIEELRVESVGLECGVCPTGVPCLLDVFFYPPFLSELFDALLFYEP